MQHKEMGCERKEVSRNLAYGGISNSVVEYTQEFNNKTRTALLFSIDGPLSTYVVTELLSNDMMVADGE